VALFAAPRSLLTALISSGEISEHASTSARSGQASERARRAAVRWGTTGNAGERRNASCSGPGRGAAWIADRPRGAWRRCRGRSGVGVGRSPDRPKRFRACSALASLTAASSSEKDRWIAGDVAGAAKVGVGPGSKPARFPSSRLRSYEVAVKSLTSGLPARRVDGADRWGWLSVQRRYHR
jgi:hypothetical protein